MPGSCDNSFFRNYVVLNRHYEDLTLIRGVEANILDYNGTIDVDTNKIDCIDYVIASLHTPCIKCGNIEENTNALIKVMDIPKVYVIGHPDDKRYPINYDLLTAAAVEKRVLIEINNSSLNPTGCREGACENLTEMLKFGKERGLHVIMSSDAHICEDVGNIELSAKLIEDLNYPKELVLNYDEDPKRLFDFLNIKI